MKSKQILFFATAIDIQPIMESLESLYQVKYYEMGLFDIKPNSYYDSISEIPNFCIPEYSDWNRDLRVMMLPKSSLLRIREVPQRSGGLKYAIDPLENQVSICFQFGGTYQEGILLGGSCGTSFLNDFSIKIFKEFSLRLKKEFRKIGNFYVGKDAEEKLKSGWRLVTNEKISKDFDLKLNL